MVIEMCDFLKPTNWLFIQLNLKKKRKEKYNNDIAYTYAMETMSISNIPFFIDSF